MSDLPPPPPPLDEEEPTAEGDSTSPEPRGRELPRRGYERKMKPPPPRQTQPPPGMYGTPPPRATRAPRRQPPRRSTSDSGLYLPWWSLLILILVVGGCAFTIIYMVAADPLGIASNPADETPEIVVVTSQFNINNTINNGGNSGPPGSVPATSIPIATAVPNAAPTSTISAESAVGCTIGLLVEVTGTDGEGLIIREEPRQGDNIVIVADEGETFRITGGPERSVGVGGETIEWCDLEGVDSPLISGWASSDYLTVVPE